MMHWMASPGSQDRAATTAVGMAGWQYTAAVGMAVLLTFLTTFMFARERAISAKNDALKEWNRRLELRAAAVVPSAEPSAKAALADTQIREIEAKARAEYDRSISAITTELQQLYEMETKARSITGMAPRKVKPVEIAVPATGGGKGGGSGIAPVALASSNAPVMRPPHVIYGMARPTADLILQEIRLRRNSLGDLVKSMEAEKDRVSRMPSIWPLVGGAGVITSRFGYRVDPINSRIRFHEGTDISAPAGTKIRASARGKVIFSGWDGFYGNLVRIDHGNGVQTWYAHMSARDVEAGATVDREQVIGRVGSTGRSTGNHLHYEVHVNGKPVDGEKYLD